LRAEVCPKGQVNAGTAVAREGHRAAAEGRETSQDGARIAGPTAGQAPSSQGEGGRDSRVRGAGAIFQRKRIVACSCRNVTRIREPVGCEPMECCPWSSRGEHGRHERGGHDQELLVVDAAGEGRGTFFAKAGGGRRNGPRRGCGRERRKTGAGAITGKASTERERRKTSTGAWPSFRDDARSSGNLRSIARCEEDERASFEHPQGCERHAKQIAASRAPHRKMHEAATPRALPPKRWIRRKVESSRLRSLIDASKGAGDSELSDPQLDHRKVIDRPGYCTRTASLTCPGELGGLSASQLLRMVEVER
jgi:hypothetical protein